MLAPRGTGAEGVEARAGPVKPDDAAVRLFMAYRAALINYATPIVGCRAGAEDVVQEAFLRFAPFASAAGRVAQPAAYLRRIVRNLAMDWTRRLRTEARHRQGEPEAWMIPPAAPSPERQASDREALRRLARVLAELPVPARRACEMHRLDGLTLEEVAERLGVSVATAHRLVRDALALLASRLAAEDR